MPAWKQSSRLTPSATRSSKDDSPGFGKLKTALTDVRAGVHQLLEKKREKEPDPVEAAPAEEAAVRRQRAEEAKKAAGCCNGKPGRCRCSASPPTAARRWPGHRGRGYVSAQDANRSVPRPICFCAACAGASCAALPAWSTVRSSRRRPQKFASRSSASRWPSNGPNCWKRANRQWPSPDSRAWLDLQRLSVAACTALGKEYRAHRDRDPVGTARAAERSAGVCSMRRCSTTRRRPIPKPRPGCRA